MYRITIKKQAEKQFRKLDQQTQRLIKSWVFKHLAGALDPRLYGKALTGSLKGLWRYRVGDYRLIAEIRDKELVIFIIEIEHRSKVYR